MSSPAGEAAQAQSLGQTLQHLHWAGTACFPATTALAALLASLGAFTLGLVFVLVIHAGRGRKRAVHLQRRAAPQGVPQAQLLQAVDELLLLVVTLLLLRLLPGAGARHAGARAVRQHVARVCVDELQCLLQQLRRNLLQDQQVAAGRVLTAAHLLLLVQAPVIPAVAAVALAVRAE